MPLESSIMLLESSIMLLENIYSTDITHDNYHMIMAMYLLYGPNVVIKWKGSNCKQSTRWQYVSWLKASAFYN